MNANRRTFLLTAGSALGGHSAPPADQVTLGVMGSGSRGTFVMAVFQKDPSVRVSTICDVYEPNLMSAGHPVAAKTEDISQEPRGGAGPDSQIRTRLRIRHSPAYAKLSECIRTRKEPAAPMGVAFQAALVVQMANLEAAVCAGTPRRAGWRREGRQIKRQSPPPS